MNRLTAKDYVAAVATAVACLISVGQESMGAAAWAGFWTAVGMLWVIAGLRRDPSATRKAKFQIVALAVVIVAGGLIIAGAAVN